MPVLLLKHVEILESLYQQQHKTTRYFLLKNIENIYHERKRFTKTISIKLDRIIDYNLK